MIGRPASLFTNHSYPAAATSPIRSHHVEGWAGAAAAVFMIGSVCVENDQ